MQKIQVPMKELTEKYKDDPKRKNEEMMKLYRTHKVNPLGGCLPMLVQFPIFIGFFYMLRTSSELRFAEFLWIADLSQPEKLFSWGFSIPILGQYFNLLPFLMGITMFYQMRMTPAAGSSEQQAILKFMPVMMVVMLYNFGAGLCLYWTVQNLMTILQQTITNKRKDKDEIAAELEVNDPNKRVENPLIRKKPKRKPKNQ
jgi:YidC/Oxa1 family membrane protein insertase